jgi:hypothetical protein
MPDRLEKGAESAKSARQGAWEAPGRDFARHAYFNSLAGARPSWRLVAALEGLLMGFFLRRNC